MIFRRITSAFLTTTMLSQSILPTFAMEVTIDQPNNPHWRENPNPADTPTWIPRIKNITNKRDYDESFMDEVYLPRPINNEQEFLIKEQTNEQRRRYKRIHQTVEDMLGLTLLQAEKMDGAPEKDKSLWDKLLKNHRDEIFKNYLIEVHYLNLDSYFYKALFIDVIDPTDREKYRFRQMEDHDMKRLIPLTIFRPNVIHRVPVAIHMHGGPRSLAEPKTISPIFSALAGLGYAIVAPNYRGSDWSDEFANLLSGNEDKYPLEDLQATIAYIRKLSFYNRRKVMLTGISYGTSLNSIIFSKVASDLSGVFLHTGGYQNGSFSSFNVISDIYPDLPILLVSGMKDKDPHSALNYVRALQDVSQNFKYYLVENGGHHLVSKPNQTISPYDLNEEIVAKTLDKNSVSFKDIINHTAQRYNAVELTEYMHTFVEFLDNIAYGKIPAPNLLKREEDTVSQKESIPNGIDIVHKAVASQGIKAREMKQNPNAFFGPTLLHGNEELKNALYTFSEAHLKIILGGDYDDTSLENTIKIFLQKYDQDKPVMFEEYEKRYKPTEKDILDRDRLIAEKTAENTELVALILKILQKEKEYKGNYVLYHGTHGSIGFVYDVYSSLRRLLIIQAHDSKNWEHCVTRVRLLDDAFEKILCSEDLIKKMNSLRPKYSDVVYNYTPGYKEVGISAQFFLFGSYKYWFNSTFFRYFRENVSASDVKILDILKSFFTAIGITDPDVLLEINNDYAAIHNDYNQHERGRLLQIFISDEIMDEGIYVAETGGDPLNLKTGDQEVTHLPSKILINAVQKPLDFEKILEENRDNFKKQGYDDRKEFQEKKEGLRYINSVEARACLNPQDMDDPRKIQIISHSLNVPQPAYLKAIEKSSAKNLAIWLESHPKLGMAMTHREPPLVKLQRYVDENTDGKEFRRTPYTLYDLLSANQWSIALDWLKNHREDIEKGVDAEGHPLLYQLLLENKFEGAQSLVDLGEKVNRKNSKGDPIFYDVLYDGSLSAARWLIKHGLQLNEKLSNGMTALFNLIDKGKPDVALELIKAGADIDFTDTTDSTLLMGAADNGFTSIVNALLEKKKELDPDNFMEYLNHQNKVGNTAFIVAIKTEHLETSWALFNAGADIDLQNDSMDTALEHASQEGYTKLVEAILKKKKELDPDNFIKYLNHEDKQSLTALAISIANKHTDTSLELIKAGADIDFILKGLYYGKDCSLLIVAVFHGLTSVVEALLEKKKETDPENFTAYLNYKNKEDETALHTAINYCRTDSILALLKAGADIYVQDKYKNTLLMIASMNQPQIVESLLQIAKEMGDEKFKTYLNHQNNNGHTALMTTEIQNQSKIALALLKAGAAFDCKDKNGSTVLIWVSEIGDKDMFDFIWEKGKTMETEIFLAYLNHQDSFMNSALHSAIYKYNEDIALSLISVGVNINQKYEQNETALILASRKHKFANVVEALLQKKKKEDPENLMNYINHKNEKGLTALLSAIDENHQEVILKLKEYGAELNLELNPEDTPLVYALSMRLSGNLEECKLTPDNCWSLARIYKKVHAYKKAGDYYKEGILLSELKKKTYDPYKICLAAYAYYTAGNFEEAAHQMKKYMTLKYDKNKISDEVTINLLAKKYDLNAAYWDEMKDYTIEIEGIWCKRLPALLNILTHHFEEAKVYIQAIKDHCKMNPNHENYKYGDLLLSFIFRSDDSVKKGEIFTCKPDNHEDGSTHFYLALKYFILNEANHSAASDVLTKEILNMELTKGHLSVLKDVQDALTISKERGFSWE